jgi:hypothetical protein
LKSAGFVDVVVKLKEESRDFIKNWLPGSGCEKYVVSADITACKPVVLRAAVLPEAAVSTAAGVEATEEPAEGC